MKNTLVSLFLFFNLFTLTYAGDGQALIKSLRNKYAFINDYQADVRIRADISFLKILPVNAKVYYKKENKFTIKSKGIVILPKQGPNMVSDFLSATDKYSAIDMGMKADGGKSYQVINMIPLSDTSDVILATFFINPTELLINKARITTKSMGTVDVQFAYGKYASYLLPDSVIFKVDVKKFKVPRAISGDIDNSAKQQKERVTPKNGLITIRYKNYIINKGIKEEVFK